MCELFAVNAARPVRVNAYLEEFFSHSHKHKDGWGITWRKSCTNTSAPAQTLPIPEDLGDDSDVFLYREPVAAWRSTAMGEFCAHAIDSCRLEAHIRLSTCGNTVRENCHPFYATDISGREWTLIHNGILFNEELLATYDRREAGQTDSERALLFLIDVVNEAAMRSGGDLGFDTRF